MVSATPKLDLIGEWRRAARDARPLSDDRLAFYAARSSARRSVWLANHRLLLTEMTIGSPINIRTWRCPLVWVKVSSLIEGASAKPGSSCRVVKLTTLGDRQLSGCLSNRLTELFANAALRQHLLCCSAPTKLPPLVETVYEPNPAMAMAIAGLAAIAMRIPIYLLGKVLS